MGNPFEDKTKKYLQKSTKQYVSTNERKLGGLPPKTEDISDVFVESV
jgi:hypothetical protein